jgi:hypothetical protein
VMNTSGSLLWPCTTIKCIPYPPRATAGTSSDAHLRRTVREGISVRGVERPARPGPFRAPLRGAWSRLVALEGPPQTDDLGVIVGVGAASPTGLWCCASPTMALRRHEGRMAHLGRKGRTPDAGDLPSR